MGKKSLLFIRIDFDDIPGAPVTRARAAEVMQRAEDFYRTVSDRKLSIESTFTPTLRMPQPATR